MRRLLDLILENRTDGHTAAFIGIAKNAGKTTALNVVVREAENAGLSVAIASYGRDGEDTDAITLLEKPRIRIPPGAVFVTTERLYDKSGLDAEVMERTPYETVLGRVCIYRNGKRAGDAELAGINRGARMAEVKRLIGGRADLMLIDGALDRRSCAMPGLAHGMILSTGAAAGADEDTVASKTAEEIRRLTLPAAADPAVLLKAPGIVSRGMSAVIRGDGTVGNAPSGTFGRSPELDALPLENNCTLVLGGSITDSFAEHILHDRKAGNMTVVVNDGTRIFLSARNMNLLESREIRLRVLEHMNLIAVTVNPFNPYGPPLCTQKISSLLAGRLAAQGLSTPVIDVKSAEYNQAG